MTSFTAFLALAALFLLLERVPKLRRQAATIQVRWATNIGLALAAMLIISHLFPASVTDVARALNDGVVGNLQLHPVPEAVLLFIIWDLWRYWEHRVFHEVPLLWRAHLVHHSDTAIDVTTSQRHHPFEGIITATLAFILVFALGFSAQAIGIYLFAATLSALFTHANIRLPEAIDRPLRAWLVTPAVHAMHHSSYQPETDSNYGAVLTVWDHLFGTYTAPGTGPARFGLEYFRSDEDATLLSTLLQPFRYQKTGLCTGLNDNSKGVVRRQQPALDTAWRQPLLYGGIGLALVSLLMWPTVVQLTDLWNHADEKAYQYAWLVPPTFAYLLGWYHRDRILLMTPTPGFAGLRLAGIAIGFWLAAFSADFKLGQQLALVLALQAVALCAVGRQIYRKLLPIMLFLFLMIPCGDIATPLLRDLTLKWLEWFAIITGLPHAVSGYHISFADFRYVVYSACSGLGFFTLGGFLGYSFGLLIFNSLPKVLAMAAIGAGFGIVTNALRVSLIVVIDISNGIQMDMAGHKEIQWLLMLGMVGVLLLLAGTLKRDGWVGATTPDAIRS